MIVKYVTQRSILLRMLFERQGIKYFDNNVGALLIPGDRFICREGDFILSSRGHIARFKSHDMINIVNSIIESGSQVKLSNKNDIIAYKAGTSTDLIGKILDICNKTKLPEDIEAERAERERMERKRHEEQEKAEINKLISNLTEKIQLNPNDATIYNFRGLVYTQKEDMNRAFEDFNQAIQLNPNYAEAYCNRGGAYSNKGSYDQAIADYNQAIQLNPNDEKAYFCRGAVYSDEKGDYGRAIADFEASLKINPNNAFVRQFLEKTRKLKMEAEEQEFRRIEEKKRWIFWTIFGGIIGGLLFAFLTVVVDTNYFILKFSVVAGILCFITITFNKGIGKGCGAGCGGLIGGVIIAVALVVLLPEIPLIASAVIGIIIGVLPGWDALYKIKKRSTQ